MARLTPMMTQYREAKREHPDALLFFRMGDFYELFEDDAKVASRELGLTLTSRDKANPIPMAGVPVRALDTYLRKLLRKGHRVIIRSRPVQLAGGDVRFVAGHIGYLDNGIERMSDGPSRG